jgi:hypothetical protein
VKGAIVTEYTGLETEDDPRLEWKDMPEFVQEKKRPYQQITVRFASEEDVQEFARLIGQPLTPKTKSIWHPRLQRGLPENGKCYVSP